MENEEVIRLERLIKEDNVDELSNILNSNENLQNNFNNYHSTVNPYIKTPLLLFAVQEKSQKVVEYLLSQDFVDNRVCNARWDNIYHVVCGIRGAEQLFSIIESKVPHELILGISVFHIACEKNNLFIVKRVHEILESLQVDLTPYKNDALEYAINNDIEVFKYVSSIDGIQFGEDILLRAIMLSKFDIVVHLFNIFLCQSIPSHLHDQFHIFQFSTLPFNNNNNDNNRKNEHQIEEKIKRKFDAIKIQMTDYHSDDIENHFKKRKLSHNRENNGNDENNNNNNNNESDYYLRLVEKNFQKILASKLRENRIWHCASHNENLEVVQLIFSLKGIQTEILNDKQEVISTFEIINNPLLTACQYNSNIKVIKYIHKLFPEFIFTNIKYNGNIHNIAHIIVYNYSRMKKEDKLNILHYFYLNRIDIHLLSRIRNNKPIIYESLFTRNKRNIPSIGDDIGRYLKVISQDFDYLNNEHDEQYKKPSFWKEIDNNNNHSSNNVNEQSKRVNEWKNRFDEHVLHHLSKMIQEQMPNLHP